MNKSIKILLFSFFLFWMEIAGICQNCPNQLFNSDFALMDSANCTTIGFKTDMDLDCNPPTNGARNIHITDNSYLWNGGFWNGVTDHTSGGGTGFILGDGPSSNSRVWYQSINVIKGRKYEFSAWFVNGNVNGKYKGVTSSFEMRIGGLNGLLIASTGVLGKTTPWKKHSGLYTATKTELIELDIIIKGGHSAGNDFAIDDISFKCDTTVVCQKTSYKSLDICKGDSIMLKVYNGKNYSWSPAFQISSSNNQLVYLWPDTSRMYICHYDDTASCKRIDSFQLNVYKVPLDINLPKDTILCEGERVTFDLSQYNYDFEWHDGSSSKIYTSKEDTLIWVKIINANCINIDSTQITYENKPRVNLPSDTTLCLNTVLVLDATYPRSAYFWNSNSSKNASITVKTDGLYKVTVMNDCGSTQDSLIVKFKGCPCTLFAPNAFSPNRDGLNEIFILIPDCDILDYNLKIVNRWGEILYETDDYNIGWNGKYEANDVPQGAYFWLLTYSGNQGATVKRESKAGIVILLR